MRTATYADINGACLEAISRANLYQIRAADFFLILYSFGCRSEEARRFCSWEYLPATGEYLYQTAKTKVWRRVRPKYEPEEIYDIYAAQPALLATYSYATWSRIFTWSTAPRIFYTAGKELELHLFRHRYATYLRELGYTNAQIAADMAITASIAGHYANDSIFTNL